MRMLRHFAAIALFAAAGQAGAICPIFPAHYSIGDTASDAACSYNSIQSGIDAAGTCPVVLDVTGEHQYTGGFCTPGQTDADGCHLSIDGKNVTLQGWGSGITCASFNQNVCQTCGPGQTVPLVTLDGNNNGTLLMVTGSSNVTLRNLTLSHGNAGSGNGGGVAFGGSGSLSLDATTVNLNQATNGAGIAFNGSGGNANLTLGANTQIIVNTAGGSGGGIRVEGNARLYALAPQTLIGYNHAPNGYGGGVQVIAPATANVGSPGYGNGGVIFGNDAQYGGGLSLQATSEGSATARLFAVDPAKPARISQNIATHSGGAVHLKPASGTITSAGGAAVLCAYGLRIDGNSAEEGVAIYGDTDASTLYGTQSSAIEFGQTDADTDANCTGNEPIATLGAVTCSAETGCNQIDGNTAQDSNAVATAGSTILLQNQGYLLATALALRGNSGAHAVRTFDSAAALDNCLVVDGAYTAAVFQFENQGQIGGGPGTETLRNCTIANNTVGSGAVITSAYGLTLHDSIIAQPGIATLDYTAPANQLDVAYVVSNNISTLPGGNDVMVGVPTFVDAANGDYRLQPVSLGIDYAPAAGGVDFDGKPRDTDLSSVTNRYGARDIGAYERQNLFNNCGASDTFFCDGFEP